MKGSSENVDKITIPNKKLNSNSVKFNKNKKFQKHLDNKKL
jgi:hypothetical protein